MTLIMILLAFVCYLPFTVSTNVDEKFPLGHQKGKMLEGDMLVPLGVAKQRNAILRAQRWPNNVLTYTLNATGFTQENIDMIKDAMKTIEKHTCLKFQERTDEKAYILIFNGPACYSNVGWSGTLQYLSLNNVSCMSHRTAIHELLHSVGLSHEQSRYDRNDYLTVHRDKLANDADYDGVNLAIVTETKSSFYGVPYNYASVMHYDAWALGKGKAGDITMEPKDPSMLAVMGFTPTANETDFEKVRRLYECNGKYPVVPPADVPCEDDWPDCDIQSDQCKTDRWTVVSCRKTCGYCKWGAPIAATPRPFCQDYRPDCDSQHFKDKNQCEKDQEWRERVCPFTCGTCDKSKTQFPKTTTGKTPPPCVDQNPACKDYKKECNNMPTVKQQCRKTCNLC